ncbi:hypothetical protein ACFO4L_11315 [Bacillus daqingensis]|uniref:Uncharacterized protein n=1 Tax=Bacillus daqingensis TaxID=872396 RepID=A0ABV9NV36_9BACI
MNATLKELLTSFPHFEQTAPEQLTDQEYPFYALYLFLKDPDTNGFDIRLLNSLTDREDALMILSFIERYIQTCRYSTSKATMPIKRPPVAYKTKKEPVYFNQTDVARYLQDQGHKSWNRHKVHVYYKRGKLPEPDKQLSNTPYWELETVQLFSRALFSRLD